MIAENRDNEGDESSGAGEGPHLTPTQQNKIVGMMLNPKRRWKLTKAAKSEAIATTLNNMGDDDGRVRNAAVANLVRMEAQNMADQHKAIDKRIPDLHEHGGVIEHRLTTQELLDQADYVEWLRKREQDSDPRLIRSNGHKGNGKPVDDGPTRNGH
jgi:hypothetical protein